METLVIGFVSLLVSITAVTVSIWNVRRDRVHALNSNATPVIAQAFQEYRSVEFRTHVSRVCDLVPKPPPAGGLDALPTDYRDSAYAVCYFFDYLGVLVAFGLIDQNIILGFMSSQITRTWHSLEDNINAERRHRSQAYRPDAPPGFLSYFEYLVKLVKAAGGPAISVHVRTRLGLARIFRAGEGVAPRRGVGCSVT